MRKTYHLSRFDFFLEEMLSAMRRVLDYTSSCDYHRFTTDTIIRDAVIRNFEVMGEAVKHVPFRYQKSHAHIPWTHMLSLRNFIVHEFFDVDDDILWEIITNDLPANVRELEKCIAEMPDWLRADRSRLEGQRRNR